MQVTAVGQGPDERRGLSAVCWRDGTRYEISLVDLRFETDSEVGPAAAAYRRWLGCNP